MSDNKLLSMLISYQVPHVYQLLEALKSNQCVLDGSDTGTGKTYTALACCGLLNLKPFIICPKSMISSWISVSNYMGIEITGLSNYEKLKGGKYYTPDLTIENCPYLDKIISEESVSKKKTSKKNKEQINDKVDKVDNLNKLDDDINNYRVAMKEKFEKTKQNNEEIHNPTKLSSEQKNAVIKKFTEATKLNKELKKKKDYIFQFPYDTIIIVDEAHKCKNYKSGNSNMLLSMKDSGRKIILLSATITDKIDCFKPFGVMLDLYSNVYQYKMWLRNKINHRQLMISKAKNESCDEDILHAIHNTVYPTKGSRMKIKELGELFPENQVTAQCYYSEHHDKVNKIYDLINSALQDIKKKELSSEAFGEIIRCRMRLEMLKLPIMLDLIDEGLENGKSIAVFVNFRDSMDYLMHHIKEDCSLIHGQQTIEEREFNIEQFQKNRNKVIIAIVQAGGVGISLHDLHGRPRMSVISPSWNGIDVAQCLGRIHRAGSLSSAIQRIVYIAKSYEEEICKKLNSKLHTIAAINDGHADDNKIATEIFEEDGEDKINNTVINLTSNTLTDENITDNPKKIKRKKYKKTEESKTSKKSEQLQNGSNNSNGSNGYCLDDDDEKKPFATLPGQYKVTR